MGTGVTKNGYPTTFIPSIGNTRSVCFRNRVQRYFGQSAAVLGYFCTRFSVYYPEMVIKRPGTRFRLFPNIWRFFRESRSYVSEATEAKSCALKVASLTLTESKRLLERMVTALVSSLLFYHLVLSPRGRPGVIVGEGACGGW